MPISKHSGPEWNDGPALRAPRTAGADQEEQAMTRSVLVIEDHQNIARLVKLHLEDFGCRVELAYDGPTGLARGRAGDFDLIVLDLSLPALDGLEVCCRLREKRIYTPILMLTARSGEDDRVTGLEAGADDYLAKPFSIAEFMARVKAIFRRSEIYQPRNGRESVPLRFGELEIDELKRTVTVAGREVPMAPKEFELLLLLARNPGRVFTRAQILDVVWSYDYTGYDTTVKSHINRIRAKIERDPANPRYILTAWGTGYKFSDADPEKDDLV
jgi:DNA-binding response OmpR family regulator